MSEWIEYKLEDVCLKITDGSHFSPKLDSNGKKIIGTVKDMLDYNFDIKNCKRINDNEYEELIKNDCKPQLNDILFSKDGTIGKVLVFNFDLDIVVLSSIAIIRPNLKLVNPDFLGYILKSKKSQDEIIENYKSGSAVPRVILRDFKRFPINLPGLPTQNAIVEILSSLDDKIELNNKINQELETLAQTLFKQWFIDFEFPNENGEPFKSSGGEMVDSELGEIPKGWFVQTLKDEFIINMGQSPSGDTYNTDNDGMIFFQGRSDFGFRFPSIRMYTNAPKKVVKKFETLISVRAPVGDINMAADVCCIGRGLGSISHAKKLYTYTYYKILSIQAELKSYDNEGTVFGSINKETLGNIKTIIPPILLCEKFEDLFKEIDSKIYNLDLETQNLIKTRDTLLPKLISGELEINEITN
jgi:type I restriction enzyme S subunit